MSSERLTIAKRELASLKSEKTIVLALLIQLFVAAFSSFLVVGLVSLYDPGSVQGYTLQVGVTGDASDELLAAAENQKSLDPQFYADPADARDAWSAGRIDAILTAERTANGTIGVTATVPRESIRTTVMVVQLRDLLKTTERRLRDQRAASLTFEPLELPREVQNSPYFGFTYTILIPLLMFLPVFISGSIAVDTITEEIQRGTLDLLRVAPVSLADIVDAKLLATATLAPAQAALWLLLLSFNGTTVVHGLVLVGVVAALSLAVVSVGLAIALLAPDRRQAQLLYSSGVLLVIVAASLLPEHPANTIAKLAIGSTTSGTWLSVAGYAVIGVVTFLGVRVLVDRLNPETL